MSTPTRKNIQTFSARLRKARLDADVRQEEAAAKLKIALRTYNSWERGETFPRVPDIIKLSQLYATSLEWLLLGQNRGLIQEIEGGPTLPLLGEIGCDFRGRTNEIPDDAPRVPVPREVIARGGKYFIRAQGDSMREAGIVEGDLVALAPCPLEDVDYGSRTIYALLVAEDQACGVMLKRLRVEDGEIWAVPENREMLPRRLSALGTEVRVFGRVVAVLKVYE